MLRVVCDCVLWEVCATVLFAGHVRPRWLSEASTKGTEAFDAVTLVLRKH